MLAFPGALPTPRPRPPAEPVPSPGSTLGSVSKVRMQLPPTLVGLAPSFLHPGVPARFPGAPEPSQQMAARSGTSGGRWSVCVCVCVCVCVEREREREMFC